MSNDPRENLHGSDSQELADVTADAARTGAERAASTPAHTSDEAPAPRSALSSFEEILSGATHEADAPTADTPAETLPDDGAQDLQETLVSSTPLITTDEAEATPAARAFAASGWVLSGTPGETTKASNPARSIVSRSAIVAPSTSARRAGLLSHAVTDAPPASSARTAATPVRASPSTA